MKKYRFLLLILVLFAYTCGGSGGGGGSNSLPKSEGGSGAGTGTGTGGTTVASISLTATPTNITVGGSSSIQATVLDSLSANVPDGTTVAFTISPSSYGSITSSMDTVSGIATATFIAANTAGPVTVTATSGSVSDTVIVTIAGAESGSISFTSATPSNIGIKGTSQTETSTITFSVKDINGTPVSNGTAIDFCMTGPNGGEYINDLDVTTEAYIDANSNNCYDTGESYTDSDGNGRYTGPRHASVSTISGVATATLHSGYAPGNVTIFARVVGKTLVSSSPVISIGGGMPSAKHLTVATSKFNLEGLGYADIQATISTYVADRVGNANVLQGTTVSYFTEAGATITSSSTLNNQGATSVIFRTQNPIPEDVTPDTWENTLCVRLESQYGSTSVDVSDGAVCTEGHPRDGWAAITVMMTGEEAFNDTNGNGVYDGSDTYTDTPQEAFIDKNDNSSRDTSPFEEFKDDNGDGLYDGTLGSPVWDSNKTIFDDIKLLITGAPSYVELSRWNSTAWVPLTSGTFNIANGDYMSFKLLIADININPLISGTTVTISSDAGKQSGTSSYTFPDIAPSENGPVELLFTIASDDDTDAMDPEVCTITVAVTWKGIKYTYVFTGIVD
ncbi:MAG: hypothetical protein C4581_03125 [Nitrospiraceae bacterium]|nr:MAG: hypothetical protein C4581_03125 [Nitrospiraceae bacterium]